MATGELLAVIGMHRSGTSLVAGMLRALGWDVGPAEDLMAPKPDNPRGFVEHLPAVRINDRLLYRLGGSWKQPPAFPPRWETDRDLDDLRQEAQEVADRLTARGDRVLFKDPRLSLTLPFWQTVVTIDQAVLVLRPPRPVVQSLLRRGDGLDAAGAAALYVRYLLAALRADVRLHVVAPEALLADPDHELSSLGTALGRQPDPAELEAAQRHVESELWGRSSRAHEDEPAAGPALDLAVHLHALLTGGDAPAWREPLALLTTVEELGTAADRHGQVTAKLQLKTNEWRERVDRLRETQQDVRGRRDQLLDERDRLRAQSARLREQLERTEARVAELEAVDETRASSGAGGSSTGD